MSSRITQFRSGRSRWSFLVVALAGFGLSGLPAPARGDVPAPWEIHREVREHVHDALRHLVTIPERIHDHHRRHLEVFFGGHTYYAPHRHQHVVYRYPVWVGPEVYYRPYTYCGDRLFTRVDVRPRLWVDWGHGSHGAWCGHHRGYYPNRHDCFRGRGWQGKSNHGRHDAYRHHGRDDRYDERARYDRRDRYEHRRYREHDRDDDDDDRGRKRKHGRDRDDD